MIFIIVLQLLFVLESVSSSSLFCVNSSNFSKDIHPFLIIDVLLPAIES